MFYRKIQNGITLLIAMLAITVASCGADKNEMADYERDKSEMRTEIQNAIAQIDRTLDTARVKIDTLGQETSRAYDSTLQDLEQDRAKLEKRLSDLEKTSRDQWQKFKSDASHDINSAYNKIKDLDSSKSSSTD